MFNFIVFYIYIFLFYIFIHFSSKILGLLVIGSTISRLQEVELTGTLFGKAEGAKTRGAAGPEGFGHGTSRGTPITMIPPRLFHIMSFFWHPGLV